MKIKIAGRLPSGVAVQGEIDGEMIGEQVAVHPVWKVTVDGDFYFSDCEWSVTHVKSGWRVSGSILDQEAARDWALLLGAVDIDEYWERYQAGRDVADLMHQVEALKAEWLERWDRGLWLDE